MRRILPLLIVSACGGGGGGGGPPPPPPPPYAQTATTGLAVALSYPNAATIPPFVLVAVSETEMAGDLNADGDMLDDVVHEVNATTGAVKNLRLAISGRIVASDLHFAFLASETAQGGTDLSGDGDSTDLVWHVYDPALAFLPGANPQNTGLAGPGAGSQGAGTTGGFVLLQSEAASRVDLNADGDQLDTVPRAYHGLAFNVSTLVLPAALPFAPLVARNGRVLFLASEPAQGASLNGDPDQLDFSLFAVNFVLGPPQRVPIGGGGFARSVANHPYALTDGAAVYFIDEASENGIDLNNDADTNDAVLAVFDLATGAGETLPFTPVIPSFAVAGSPAVGIGTGNARALVAVSEAGQKRDLNNDFDQTDVILAWIDTTAPAQLRLFPTVALTARTPVIEGTRGLVAVSEGASGFNGTDLNGDGDKGDTVLFLVDTGTVTGSTTNLGLATATYALTGLDAFVGVDETSQGGADLNGNGSNGDVIQYYIDMGDATPAPRGLGIIISSGTFFRLTPEEVRACAVLPEGQSSNYGDLNGDGDTDDSAIELITLDPSLTPPPFVSPTPFFAGECSGGVAQPLRTGDNTFVFPTSEAMAGTDLNGDADLLDTVLCVTTIQ